MFFHTPEFFTFLLITMFVYYKFPGSRLWLLAFANIVFYGAAGFGFLLLFIAVTIVNFLLSLKLNGKYGRLIMIFTISLNVLNLAFFKYSLLLLSMLEKAAGIELVRADMFFASFVLPVGISFYTFQLISYLVDVYKGKIQPSRNLSEFWVFISFFGHLVAGPIMRGKDFLPQIEQMRGIRYEFSNMQIGAAYLALGLFKKIVLADALAQIADKMFNSAAALTGIDSWIAAYLFAFQIYFDFSAYSDMAVGIGFLFGMKLDVNFRTPYLSANGTEFWRRWHITLSSWIKDYIYIPLGGSRRGPVRQYANLFLAMTISGLWHGAAVTFLLWGMFHGGLLIVHKLYDMAKNKLGLSGLNDSRFYHYCAVIVFFHLTCIGWVLFRAESFSKAVHMIKEMADVHPSQLNGTNAVLLLAVFGLFLLHIAEYLARKHSGKLSSVWHRFIPSPVRGLSYALFIAILVLFLRGEETSFIYFQF